MNRQAMSKLNLPLIIKRAIEDVRTSGKRELHLNGALFASLTEIPEEIFNLTNLRILNVSGGYAGAKTNIRRIPPSISKLTSLEVLILETNQIEELPDELFQLEKLEQLYLKQNVLSEVPSSISRLTALQKLDLSQNQIKEIPSEIEALTKLETLDLDWNKLTFLPLQIGRLDKLKRLDLQENKITNIPVEILNRSTAAIVNYCKSVLDEEVIHLYEAKLLLVGEGGVGKTCLLERMISDSFSAQMRTTEGIDIHIWMHDIDKISEFRINVWDFGGQEIYHATHQFFLTKRSLYLFVWTARNDEIDFDYWLNVIALLSNNSPVIIVMNKADERIRMIDESAIQQRFGNVLSFHHVSALTGAGINELVDDIKNKVVSLEHIGSVLPKVWVLIREKLESLNQNYISHRRYRSICSRVGLDPKKADFLSQYYHDLGVFLHFQENPILRTIVFLKPEWATSAVYKIVDTPDVIKNFGRFRFDQLKAIWRDYPEEKHVHLVELMKKFELCFQLADRDEYIIPELLQPSAPSFEWDYEDNMRFEYHYDFMPSGIMTRFIVINHHLIKEGVYWKNGAVFTREESSALVTSDPFKRKIQLWIHGPEKKDVLSILRDKMDYIHGTLNRPAVKEMLKCICQECNASEHPFFYEYETLKRFYYKGKMEITCSYSAQDVSITALLGGIETLASTPEQEMLEILRRLKKKDDNEESLMRKANEIIQLKPSFMGFGIDLNAIISSLLKREKRHGSRHKNEQKELLGLPPAVTTPEGKARREED